MTTTKWLNISPATLSDGSNDTADLKGPFQAYKEAYKLSQDYRLAFEAAFTKAFVSNGGVIPSGKALVFNYRFGQIGVSIGEARGTAKTVAKASVNLENIAKAFAA